jgi:hypothetical protein
MSDCGLLSPHWRDDGLSLANSSVASGLLWPLKIPYRWSQGIGVIARIVWEGLVARPGAGKALNALVSLAKRKPAADGRDAEVLEAYVDRYQTIYGGASVPPLNRASNLCIMSASRLPSVFVMYSPSASLCDEIAFLVDDLNGAMIDFVIPCPG